MKKIARKNSGTFLKRQNDTVSSDLEAINCDIQIQRRITSARGVTVMLDRDLAELYGVETRVLNQAVKRNLDRFPASFMFRLTKDEYENLKSQNVMSSYGGDRQLPYAFTEQGVEKPHKTTGNSGDKTLETLGTETLETLGTDPKLPAGLSFGLLGVVHLGAYQ